jgi:QueT transporter.
MQSKNLSKGTSAVIVRKLTISGVVIALYVIIMFLTRNFSFGQYQIRIATSIYALAGMFPFLILPLGIANFLSNVLLGGLGPLDMFGGLLVGILTSGACYLLRKVSVYLVGIPILLIPTLLVPIWLSYLLQLPYFMLVISVGIGQIIPGIVGILILKYLEKPLSTI